MKIDMVFRQIPTANKDARRIAMFGAAVSQKALEMGVAGGDLEAFLSAAAVLVYKWIDRGRKLSLMDLFRDPYKELRDETRRFALEWELDEGFRREMG
ncbi:MAG: hypothetical protein KF784_02275 [Fimbriimonadaceae bacterium]|nr:hypothetical protein [Fimbriimonadaceae bacterium]